MGFNAAAYGAATRGLGVKNTKVIVGTASGTAIAVLSPGYTYSLTDNAGSKVSLSVRTVSLAATASATPTSYTATLVGVPINGGPVLTWILRVNVVAAPVGVPSLPRLAAALIDVAANTADAYFLTTGDSVDAGRGAGTGPTNTAGARALSITAVMAAGLAASGITVRTDAWFNSAGMTTIAELVAYNPALTIDAATWSIAVVAGLGGYILQKTSGTAGAVTMSVTNADEVDIYTRTNLTTGGLNISVDGGATVATTSQALSNGVVKTTVSLGSVGAHTISVDSVNASQVNLLGMVPRRSTQKALIVVNAGWRGSTSTNWNDAAQPWGPLQMIDVLKPVATHLCLGINDFRTGGGGTSTGTYSTNLGSIIQRARQSGDVILRSPNDIGSNGATTMAACGALVAGIATAGNYPFLDTIALIGNYATVNGAGNMADDLHPNATVFNQVGTALKNLVLSSVAAATPLAAPNSVTDTFIGAGALSSHISDSGRAWFNASGVITVGSDNSAYASSLAGTIVSGRALNTLRGVNMKAAVDVVWTTVLVQSPFIVVGAVGTDHAYCFGYQQSQGGWRLGRLENAGGTFTGIGGPVAYTPATNDVRRIEIRKEGSTITCLVDGVQVIQVTDTTFAREGWCGFSMFSSVASTASTGLRFKNFFAEVL